MSTAIDLSRPIDNTPPPQGIPAPLGPAFDDLAWPERLGDDFGEGIWRAARVLGRGGNGQVTLWQLESEHDVRKNVAVKAPLFAGLTHGLVAEARMMKILNSAQPSDHVVSILGPLNRLEGLEDLSETEIYRGPGLARIFIEYCPNGNLGRMSRKAMKKYVY
jgi:hypothetical protein